MAAASAASLLDIDRKLFYIQSKLLDTNDTTPVEDVLSEAKLWFQPRHYTEIIEERSNDSRCGYPSCRNPIIRPSDVSSILKISYKEKRIYEIGRSKLFCCWDCLQKSAIFEAGLCDTHPASRQVAIDFLLRAKDASCLSNDIVTKDYFDGSSPVEEIPDQWKRSSIQFFPSAGRSTSQPDSSSVTKASSIKGDLKIDQLVQTKKSSVKAAAAAAAAAAAPSLPVLSFYTETTEPFPLPLPMTESETSKPDGKKKKVGFVDLKSLESSVGEKWVIDDNKSAVKETAPKKCSALKKSSLRSLDYTSINAIEGAKWSIPMGTIAEKVSASPGPMLLSIASNEDSMGAIIQSDLEAEVLKADSSSVTDSEDTDDDGSDNSARGSEDDLSLFMLMWTTLDDLFGDSLSVICTTAADSDALLSSDGTDALEGSSTTSSSFSAADSNSAIVASSDQRIGQEVIEERFSINPTLLASHRAVSLFVERGFNTAEAYCSFSVFLSEPSRARYYAVKAEILAAIGSNNIICPRLKSSEFTFLALLVIDAIVIRQSLLLRVPPDLNAVSEEWGSKLKVSVEKILRTRAGRHVENHSARNLRDGDLELLRNFFVRKLI
jgi:Rtr1/RPAP2 family